MHANDQGIHCTEAFALVKTTALCIDQSCSGKHSGTSVPAVDDAQRVAQLLGTCTLGLAANEPQL